MTADKLNVEKLKLCYCYYVVMYVIIDQFYFLGSLDIRLDCMRSKTSNECDKSKKKRN